MPNWKQEFYDYVYSFYGKHPEGIYLQDVFHRTNKRNRKILVSS